MLVTFTVAKFKGKYLPFGIFSMAIFRILFLFDKQYTLFRKLMGSGKSGTFDIYPAWNQWTYLFTWKNQEDFENFYQKSLQIKYLRSFSSEHFNLFLKPIQSHGSWDNVNPFLPEKDSIFKESNNPIAILTRANIRPQKAYSFWKNVPVASQNLKHSEGYIYSIGVGEVPLIRQATLSIWKDLESMKKFAYKNQNHGEVIKQTRIQNWYSEELFARFELLKITGNAPFEM